MSDVKPSTGKPRSANVGQRLFALFVFAVLGYLIWLAVTGRYDTEVDRVAAWLHRQYAALAGLF